MSSTEIILFLADMRAKATQISESKMCRSRKWPSPLSGQSEGEGCKERQTERGSAEEQPVMGIIWINPAVTCKSTDLHVFKLALMLSELASVGRVTICHVSYIHACALTVHSQSEVCSCRHVTTISPNLTFLSFVEMLVIL